MLKEISSILSQDLYKAYTQIKRDYESRGYYLSRREICLLISQSPAPRFYITPSTALRRIVTPMEYGRALPSRGQRNKMHREIYERYIKLRPTFGRDIAIQQAINQPAPSWYLSSRHINKLLYDAVHI